ncbi:hypothetical protein C8J27_103154 [Rhodobacter aestuarii]|uniref:Uncharacterized protein n=1 Tax=Rhodobacter aestuarii TaxID=453582 RepID=A0A1N7K7F5_9RHOB|nr:hypothetical protein [Rhodobacter aestuarii]PTV95826.1 hypothetical protein C8J27_103154 [Rhodobacter aestuarii]SIS57488.1 hypothetical protein SAMN05421580_102280 [Rhodobacter aestuarii]
MFALILSLSCAIVIVLWVELRRLFARRAAQYQAFEPLEPLKPRRSARLRAAPSARRVEDVPLEALPRITGFRPGDEIELAIEGPVPRAEDLQFEQIGRDVRLLIEGFPAVIVEATHAALLHPAVIRFRSA